MPRSLATCLTSTVANPPDTEIPTAVCFSINSLPDHTATVHTLGELQARGSTMLRATVVGYHDAEEVSV